MKYAKAENKILKDDVNNNKKYWHNLKSLNHLNINTLRLNLHLITIIITMIRPLRSILIADRNTNHTDIDNDVK